MHNFAEAALPGNFLVDTLPILRYVPSWIPGGGFKKTAKEWHRVVDNAGWGIYNWSVSNQETGQVLQPNLWGAHLEEGTPSEQKTFDLVWSGVAAVGGALDTTRALVAKYFLAMVLHPEVQRKAQEEIDRVIGKDRLPDIKDKEDLPYIRALVTEMFRWESSTPFGIVHSTSGDDVYNGVKIQKGTTIIPNIWYMLHDPEIYTNPSVYDPDRYESSDVAMKRVLDIAFGFGRRVCPGSHFAVASLYSIALATLATCDVLPALDEQGREIIPKAAFTSALISFPEPFKLRIRPRSEKARKLLQEACSLTEL
ncbi:hypothetical protein M422DRAFT_236734 [Sphaerobolus stellatus SS14]|uniref:Cytochrome P450 n=1 Tax=Sphaerobolus stellatus (strain SS14) TaxID=990650 RepID=A0A0C9TAA4_SPHS4|nr:hypothetical protein M422DRAFT_236734 [Sphaerobolus stellatus SS14]